MAKDEADIIHVGGGDVHTFFPILFFMVVALNITHGTAIPMVKTEICVHCLLNLASNSQAPASRTAVPTA